MILLGETHAGIASIFGISTTRVRQIAIKQDRLAHRRAMADGYELPRVRALRAIRELLVLHGEYPLTSKDCVIGFRRLAPLVSCETVWDVKGVGYRMVAEIMQWCKGNNVLFSCGCPLECSDSLDSKATQANSQ